MSSDPHDIPIRVLGLDENTYAKAASIGVTTIGDCMVFFSKQRTSLSTLPPGVIPAMYQKILPAMVEQGYMSATDG